MRISKQPPQHTQSNPSFGHTASARLSSPSRVNARFNAGTPDSASNQVVQRMLQAKTAHDKLRISQPGDQYEREADRMTEAVMRMRDPAVEASVPANPGRQPPQVQRACSGCREEINGRSTEQAEAAEVLQAKEVPGLTPAVNAGTQSKTHAQPSAGQPLVPHLRAYFEPRFKQDFRNVRVHTGRAAADAAHSVNALAYTTGDEVVFGAGQYAPETTAGRGLLAHELAHVVQQKNMPHKKLMRATRTFALTFDDGPHTAALTGGQNRTEKVLDELSSAGIRAAFFIQTGVSFRGANPIGRALVARMQADGHRVGIHTGGSDPHEHEAHTVAQSAGRLESELTSARRYIRAQTGRSTTLVRPPYGRSNRAVRATYGRLGLTNVLWDIDGDPGGSHPLSRLRRFIRAGIDAVHARGWTGTTPWAPRIVVLYHDVRAGTANNIGALINEIRTYTSRVSRGADTADFGVP